MNTLEKSCHDILYKNFTYKNEGIYMLYDTESPLANILFSAFSHILPANSRVREFHNPPQPLYRGGMINPDNPHTKEQNRVITSHNIAENQKIGLDHHLRMHVSVDEVDPEIESIKTELMSLPVGSIVILIQSTNFRLSTFRIRLELFHLGIHVLEFNHLAYIPESQFDTFRDSLIYHTDEYVRLERAFSERIIGAQKTEIYSKNGDVLLFGPLEPIRGNTGDYSLVPNKGGTFPIGEVFTESIHLSNVHGRCLVEAFPNEDFSVNHCIPPFQLRIEHGRVLPSSDFPPEFQKLYDYMVQYEGEVWVRELGFGLNPAITTDTPLADINFHERKLGVHLSLGKKHGIYGKKLPKTEIQRFHIDVFISLSDVRISDESIFSEGRWIL